ncbi:hypothetical protein SKAU_G00105590 [Synaphobranchus kaupii]|uniref:Uncharacterized protein n=1 Tax=Synaphobranchus kaupii TaxID=118154 RepID=A0A9Q1J7V1_SYNKA|nr:hypothetical protein SKAU_G00105590 [Synaphobranchus kaupii]
MHSNLGRSCGPPDVITGRYDDITLHSAHPESVLATSQKTGTPSKMTELRKEPPPRLSTGPIKGTHISVLNKAVHLLSKG